MIDSALETEMTRPKQDHDFTFGDGAHPITELMMKATNGVVESIILGVGRRATKEIIVCD